LNAIGAFGEAPADVSHGFIHQVYEKRIARVARNPGTRVNQAQGRRRDNRLFHRRSGELFRSDEKLRRVGGIVKRPCRQPRQLARVPVLKWNHDTIGRQIGEAIERVGGKARFGLLAVADDQGTGLFKAADRVSQRGLGDLLESFGRNVTGPPIAPSRDQFSGSRNAADGFGRYTHQTLPPSEPCTPRISRFGKVGSPSKRPKLTERPMAHNNLKLLLA
jgi:hypothetical protein